MNESEENLDNAVKAFKQAMSDEIIFPILNWLTVELQRLKANNIEDKEVL